QARAALGPVPHVLGEQDLARIAFARRVRYMLDAPCFGLRGRRGGRAGVESEPTCVQRSRCRLRIERLEQRRHVFGRDLHLRSQFRGMRDARHAGMKGSAAARSGHLGFTHGRPRVPIRNTMSRPPAAVDPMPARSRGGAMAGKKNDSGDRTEKPTAKRLKDARKEGDVHKSRELTSTVIVLIWLAAIWLLLPSYLRQLDGLFAVAFEAIRNPGPETLAMALEKSGIAFVLLTVPVMF